MPTTRPLFIVNPHSAGGSTGRRWEPEILPLVRARFPDARWVLTRAPRQAAALAARARRESADLVVAVGGDGTAHEVVNGLLGELLGRDGATLPASLGATWNASGPNPGTSRAPGDIDEGAGDRPVLGILPIGTGCDLVKTLGIPRDLHRALDILATGRTIPADVCEIDAVAADGRPLRRFSINMCGCGLSGDVAAQVNAARWPRHGLLAFLIATLRGVAGYRPRSVTISVDGGPPRATRLLALFVCNGEYCGGGMRPGLGARLDDGVLRVVEVGAMPLPKILVKLRRLYSGHVEGVKGVLVHQARRVDVAPVDPVLVDCDGEQPGRLPARYVVRPRSLRLVTGEHPAADRESRDSRTTPPHP